MRCEAVPPPTRHHRSGSPLFHRCSEGMALFSNVDCEDPECRRRACVPAVVDLARRLMDRHTWLQRYGRLPLHLQGSVALQDIGEFVRRVGVFPRRPPLARSPRGSQILPSPPFPPDLSRATRRASPAPAWRSGPGSRSPPPRFPQPGSRQGIQPFAAWSSPFQGRCWFLRVSRIPSSCNA